MLNGHDPFAYLKDVYTGCPHIAREDIDQLLPHNWSPSA